MVRTRDRDCVARSRVPHVVCGGRLDPHHVLPRGRGGKDEVENLVLLCRLHHSWVHEHPADAYALGLLARTSATNGE